MDSMSMLRYRMLWDVPGGGQGISTFHFEVGTATQASADAIAQLCYDFFTPLLTSLPDEVRISQDDEVVRFNAGNEIDGLYPVTPAAPRAGASSSVWAAASGARIDWLTASWVNGRRVRGRTFIVPLAGFAFTTAGVIAGPTLSALGTAAGALITGAAGVPGSGTFIVFSPSTGARTEVLGFSIPPRGSVLRSRRD